MKFVTKIILLKDKLDRFVFLHHPILKFINISVFLKKEIQTRLPTHSQASQQFVAQRLSLSDGTQTTSGNFLSVQLKERGRTSQYYRRTPGSNLMCNDGLQVSCTVYSTVLMPRPFSDKCLCVFTWKGLPALRCWSRTTERGSEPATSRARPSPAPSRHRIITEGKSDCLTSEAFALYSLGFLPG